jgi:uncharacterized protein (TIGR02284 family)
MAHDHNADTVSVLNDLIETCRDGVNGFRTAAEAVEHSAAKTLFTSRIPIIEHATAELEAEVRRLGGEPETSGHVAASIHRGWIDLKAAVTGKNDAAIITECERGEQVAVTNYEAAMKKELPAEVRAMVERQFRGTVQNLEKVRALGQAADASSPTIAPTPAIDKGQSPRA